MRLLALVYRMAWYELLNVIKNEEYARRGYISRAATIQEIFFEPFFSGYYSRAARN